MLSLLGSMGEIKEN